MPKGEQKNRNVFEKPVKTSLKVKVKKLAGKNTVKRRHRKARLKKSLAGSAQKKKKVLKNRKKTAGGLKETISQTKINEQEGRVLQEKVERSKELIMWSGVIFFMMLIAVFWIYSLRHTFEAARIKESSEAGALSWQEMTEDLEDKISGFKEDYEEIKQAAEENNNENNGLPASNEAESKNLFSTSTAGMENISSTTNIKATPKEIEELKKKLEAEQ